jgi:hypothetical protein
MVDAALVLLQNKEKIENLNSLNKTICQIENGKECVKLMLKISSIALRQNVDAAKFESFLNANFLSAHQLDAEKMTILKNMVLT